MMSSASCEKASLLAGMIETNCSLFLACVIKDWLLNSLKSSKVSLRTVLTSEFICIPKPI